MNRKKIHKLSIANFSNETSYNQNKSKIPGDALGLYLGDSKLQWRTAYTGNKTERLDHFSIKPGTNYLRDDFYPTAPRICTLPKGWKLVYVVYNYGDNREIYTNCELIAKKNVIQSGEAKFATFFINNDNMLYAQSQNCWCYLYKVYYLM